MSEIADFLTRFRPGGPWLLTAIVPDGMTNTRTFIDANAAERWALDENAAGRNLYFSVNQTTRALDKKATKADIARVEFLHVDLDPRAGEDLASERERIRKRLNGSLAADGIPPPSFIIDSGGGYQAFWRLAQPIELDGDPAKVEDAERYNIELACKLGGDATHNIDRIMRLPGGGLTNWPTVKKQEKGREPAPTKLYDWPAAEPYPLAAFKQAPAARADSPLKASSSRKAPSAKQTLGPVPAGPYGVAELEAWATTNGKQLPDTALAALVHGRDADPDKYPSRSEAAWAVCCGLARVGVPDELIVAALLDKNNGGAAHVLAQQKPTAYAHMQVAKARAEVEKQASLRWDRTNKAGEPLPSYWNTRVALQLMGVECRYDKFRDRHLVGAHELQEFAGEFSDHAERILRDEIFRRFGFDPGELNTNKAVMSLCTENRFDSLFDHLEALPTWDKVPRLDSWLIDYCGAEASPYVREAGATWLVAAIVRAYEPGTKFDYMPVLLGGQGVGKSTALRLVPWRTRCPRGSRSDPRHLDTGMRRTGWYGEARRIGPEGDDCAADGYRTPGLRPLRGHGAAPVRTRRHDQRGKVPARPHREPAFLADCRRPDRPRRPARGARPTDRRSLGALPLGRLPADPVWRCRDGREGGSGRTPGGR